MPYMPKEEVQAERPPGGVSQGWTKLTEEILALDRSVNALEKLLSAVLRDPLPTEEVGPGCELDPPTCDFVNKFREQEATLRTTRAVVQALIGRLDL